MGSVAHSVVAVFRNEQTRINCKYDGGTTWLYLGTISKCLVPNNLFTIQQTKKHCSILPSICSWHIENCKLKKSEIKAIRLVNKNIRRRFTKYFKNVNQPGCLKSFQKPLLKDKVDLRTWSMKSGATVPVNPPII